MQMVTSPIGRAHALGHGIACNSKWAQQVGAKLVGLKRVGMGKGLGDGGLWDVMMRECPVHGVWERSSGHDLGVMMRVMMVMGVGEDVVSL